MPGVERATAGRANAPSSRRLFAALRLLFAGTAWLALAACGPAPLERPEAKRLWGTLEAAAPAVVARPEAVWLEPADRSNAGPAFGEALESVLREEGVAIEPGAGLVLAYGATVEAGEGPLLPIPSIALEGTVGSASRADLGLGIGLPLFGEGPEARRFRFAVSFALKSPDGTLLWEGRAMGASEGYRLSDVARVVARLLAERIGQSVEAVPFGS